MNLHVILAAEALLRPRRADPHRLVDRLCGRPVALVDASWLVGAKNDFLHSSLLTSAEEKWFALGEALRQDFGERTEPALAFRSSTDHKTGHLVALLLALWAVDAADGVVVHEFTINGDCDPEGCLESSLRSGSDDARALATALTGSRMPAGWVNTNRVVVQPEDALFSTVLLNAVAHRLTAVEIPNLILDSAFTTMSKTLVYAVRDELDSYASQGLTPALPLTSLRLRALAEAILTWKFARKATVRV